MFLDAQTQLWSAAALTATAVSTNCYDLGAPYTSGGQVIDPATGEPLVLLIAVSVAADFTTGDETYTFQIISATASDLTTSQVVHNSVAYLTTNLTAGAIHVMPFPAGEPYQRYVGAKFVGAGTTPTITVSAFILPASMAEAKKRYYSIATRTSA